MGHPTLWIFGSPYKRPGVDPDANKKLYVTSEFIFYFPKIPI